MKVIGITGTIGSGKSQVGKCLEEMGVPVIDTDKVVHYLLSADTATRQAVVSRFGSAIQLPNGAVNRQALGALVFADEAVRKDLEAIVHPAVRAECRQRLDALGDAPIAAVLVPLLFEAGMGNQYDEVWTVVADETVLRDRLKQRDKLTDAEVERRLSAQWPQSKKAKLATRTIENSGSIEETRKQVQELVSGQLKPSAQTDPL
jgi:dephospho-CoA kinase